MLAISQDGSEPIIDVRSRKELEETGKIPNSHNVPLAEIREMAFEGLSEEEFKIKFGFIDSVQKKKIVFLLQIIFNRNSLNFENKKRENI